MTPPPDSGDRTPEEREAARREREARRAAREGRPPPADQLPGDDQPRAKEPATPGARARAAAKPRAAMPKAAAKPKAAPGTDAAAAPKGAAKPKRAAAAKPMPAAEPEPDAPETGPRAEPAAPGPPAARSQRPAPPTIAGVPPRAEEQRAGAPVALQERRPRRTAPPPDDWLDEARRLTQPGDGRGAAAPPRRTGRVHAGRIIFALAGLAVLLFAAWFANSLFQPFKGDGAGEGERQRVVVPKGASVEQIGDLLERRSIVSSSFFFQTRARLAGRTGDLKPGSYRLRRDMSFVAALDALEKGTPPSIVVLTIPEGRSRREVAGLVRGKLEGDYMKASVRSRALNPREYGAKNATSLEGFLFPATYELKRGRPMSALVDAQLSAFRNQFENVNLRYARSKNLTEYDVLTIASLVEREAQLPKERPIIASVIYNRLKQDMPLGIDATVRFITRNWERPLRESELAIPSPYNTRRHAGLPPGPIGSPGIDSIRAAARPARTGYLFYVVKPGGNGAHAFSETDAEFQRDVARYNRERERRGGQSPASP